MTLEQIKTANAEELQARLADLDLEEHPEKREALTDEEIGAMAEEIPAIEARLAELREQADAEKRACDDAVKHGETIKTFEEEKRMEKTFAINSPEYRSAWLENLQGRPIDAEARTALANGNYAIPQETANKIWGAMELYPLLNAIDVMHVPGTVILPVEGTINAAGVVAMDTAATDAADTLAQVSLGIYKLIKTVEITADVAAMAVPAFETWLVERLANKLYRLVTALVAAGTGSSQPTGLTTITATGNTYTKAAITYADILKIIAALPTEYLPNASFVMSRTTFFSNVLAVSDNAGLPIVVADRQAPAKYNVLGFPVIIEDAVGTDIIFGDLKEGYVFNFGKDPAVDRDESVGFRAGSSVFRVMALGDGKPTGVGLVRYTKAT